MTKKITKPFKTTTGIWVPLSAERTVKGEDLLYSQLLVAIKFLAKKPVNKDKITYFCTSDTTQYCAILDDYDSLLVWENKSPGYVIGTFTEEDIKRMKITVNGD